MTTTIDLDTDFSIFVNRCKTTGDLAGVRELWNSLADADPDTAARLLQASKGQLKKVPAAQWLRSQGATIRSKIAALRAPAMEDSEWHRKMFERVREAPRWVLDVDWPLSYEPFARNVTPETWNAFPGRRRRRNLRPRFLCARRGRRGGGMDCPTAAAGLRDMGGLQAVAQEDRYRRRGRRVIG